MTRKLSGTITSRPTVPRRGLEGREFSQTLVSVTTHTEDPLGWGPEGMWVQRFRGKSLFQDTETRQLPLPPMPKE